MTSEIIYIINTSLDSTEVLTLSIVQITISISNVHFSLQKVRHHSPITTIPPNKLAAPKTNLQIVFVIKQCSAIQEMKTPSPRIVRRATPFCWVIDSIPWIAIGGKRMQTKRLAPLHPTEVTSTAQNSRVWRTRMCFRHWKIGLSLGDGDTKILTSSSVSS